MTYRELLIKYVEGTLTEEENLLVEKELEKNEAINDYFAEEIEKSLIKRTTKEADVTTEHTKIEKSIQTMVFKRLAAVVAISVICVFVIIFINKYILSPLVASKYYNPTKKTAGQKHMQDFANDMRAITEVSMPGYAINMTISEHLGFGKYDIIFTRKNLFTKEKETVRARINKNRRMGNFDDFYASKGMFAFTEFWNGEEGGYEYDLSLNMQKRDTDEQLTHVSKLPPTSYISAWVRFTDDLSMEELCRLTNTYREIDFKWIAVRTAEKQGQQLMGFSTGENDSFYSGDKVNQDKYPGFQLIDIMLFSSNYDPEVQRPKQYETHYTSLLKYLVDHHEAVIALVGNTKAYDYKSALEFAENSGIRTYGALIYGEADELLKLWDSGNIMTFTIDNVIASKYIR